MNDNIWFYNLLHKIVKFFTLTIPLKLKLFYNIVKYKGRENIPIKELFPLSEESVKAVIIIADMLYLCDNLKLRHQDTYIGKLISNSINSSFENIKDFQNNIDLYKSDNHRLYMYNLLIDNNDIQKYRAITIMDSNTYQEFIRWLFMKDSEVDKVGNKPV